MMNLVCQRCGISYAMSEDVMDAIGETRYSYCEDCLRAGIDALEASDAIDDAKEEILMSASDTPFIPFKNVCENCPEHRAEDGSCDKENCPNYDWLPF